MFIEVMANRHSLVIDITVNSTFIEDNLVGIKAINMFDKVFFPMV